VDVAFRRLPRPPHPAKKRWALLKVPRLLATVRQKESVPKRAWFSLSKDSGDSLQIIRPHHHQRGRRSHGGVQRWQPEKLGFAMSRKRVHRIGRGVWG